MKPLIKLTNICAGYGADTVLTNISLTVEEHDFVGIIGPNGGGKTTLVKVLLGQIKPQQGSVEYNGKIKIGYLPQYSEIDHKFPISVREVILSGLYSSSKFPCRFRKEQHQRVAQVVQQLGLEGLEKRQIGELSGGQLQRVLLGRAIVANPQVIILDEPSTYLDRTSQETLYQELERQNQQSAIILVSHDVEVVKQKAKNIIEIV